MQIPASAAQRVKTYQEACESPGEDGIIVYCYGPDWNARSVRMLESFWNRPEVEAAAGEAKLLAVPFYQGEDPTGTAASIRGGLRGPSFSVCPTVMLLDSNGVKYAELVGSDYLGGEDGELGIKNIREKLEAHRKQLKLMAEAEGSSGATKAKLISDACDLGIKAPEGAVAMIEAADPQDSTGCLRRQKFNALKFMYDLLETTDGFLDPNFVPDMSKITKECMEVANDPAYKTRDRQAAFNLLVGASRRDFVTGTRLKTMIKKNAKIDEETDYGRLLPFLVETWGNAKFKGDHKKAARKSQKEKKEHTRDKDRRNKKAERNTSIE